MISKIRYPKMSATVSGVLAAVVALAFAECHAAARQQKTYASGQEATTAFIEALTKNNNDEVLAIFGSDAEALIFSGDPVADQMRRDKFLQVYNEQHRLDAQDDKLVLVVGKTEWPFPIPLVQQSERWHFDTDAGREEILNRRIGRNELNTVQTLLAYVDAQREYAMRDRDGDGLLEYAQKFNSDPDTQNGLYWPTTESEPPSPLGILVAKARTEGYRRDPSSDAPQPYYGYLFQILTAQGEHAKGEAFNYVVNGSMIGGFGAIASPAEYGNSGVMTFIVNHDGIVYQKDLGEQQAAAEIEIFDPNESWTPVP